MATNPTSEKVVFSQHIFPVWKPKNRIAGNYTKMIMNTADRPTLK